MVALAALAAAVFLACAGCLTPLTSRPPLTPVPVQPHPLVGVYEPGAPGSWSDIARHHAAGHHASAGHDIPACHDDRHQDAAMSGITELVLSDRHRGR